MTHLRLTSLIQYNSIEWHESLHFQNIFCFCTYQFDMHTDFRINNLEKLYKFNNYYFNAILQEIK